MLNIDISIYKLFSTSLNDGLRRIQNSCCNQFVLGIKIELDRSGKSRAKKCVVRVIGSRHLSNLVEKFEILFFKEFYEMQ